MAASCDRCDGCGLISIVDARPWSHVVGSDMNQNEALIDGQLHRPVTCGKCNGVGTAQQGDP